MARFYLRTARPLGIQPIASGSVAGESSKQTDNRVAANSRPVESTPGPRTENAAKFIHPRNGSNTEHSQRLRSFQAEYDAFFVRDSE